MPTSRVSLVQDKQSVVINDPRTTITRRRGEALDDADVFMTDQRPPTSQRTTGP